MRLKRLDIVGFKSFMDKTVVQFDQGITGIVGPNGCGKSNIVDAIRWVLGEQSPKHLRGGAMSDVIFNGSQSRPPLGMAEVTLTFQNDNPDELPLRYKSFDEIAVTRRLFRTGESEYLINKTPSRLMDITEVFLGTGIGKEAYSIIEQGRIGLIVSAKPEDRRSLIEEAAGITRYKTKKKTAERKMEHTRTNLVRVGDLVAELGKRLDSLQRQARKAERFKQLKGDLREIELHLAAHRWLEVTALRGQIHRDLEAAATEVERLTRTATEMEADLRRRRERLAQEEARLADLQSKATHAEGEARVHEERVSGLARERETLDTRTLEAREEIGRIEARLAELAGAVSSAEAALEELGRLIESDREVLAERGEALKAEAQEMSRTQGLVEAERAGALDAVRTLSQGKTHLASLDKQREELERRDARAAEEQARLQDRFAELEGTRNDLAAKVDQSRVRHAALEADKRLHSESLAEVRTSLADADAALTHLRDTLGERRSRLQSLIEIQKNFEGYGQGVRSVMLHREAIDGVAPESIEGLVADIVRAEPRCEKAVEAVLGERLQWILVSDGEAARRLVGWLQQSGSGRSSFVSLADIREGASGSLPDLSGRPGVVAPALSVITSAPEHKALVELLLGRVVIVEDLDAAVPLAQVARDATFVTLEGDVLSAAAILTGGTREEAGAGLLEKRREIDDLTAEVARLEAEHSGQADTREGLEEIRVALEGALSRLAQESHAEQLALVTHEKELARLSDEAQRLTERLEVLAHEHAQHQTAFQEITAETERTRAAMVAAEADQATREARVQALGEDLAKARQRHAALQDEVTRLQVKAAGDRERRDATAKEIESMGRSRVDLERRLAQLQGLLEGSGAAFESLDGRMAEGRQEADRLKAEAEGIRAELARARESVAAASKKLKADEGELDALRAAHETHAGEKSRLGLEDRELELELRHLGEAVEERHATSIETAIHEWHHHPAPTPDDHARMAEIRSKVERIGEVNLTAIAEYEEIKERHEFLTAQKQDLEQSLDQLGKAINKINKTSRTRFLETFEAVNDRFQRIFPRLFNGGKASLLLTNPNDPLETGVEIFVQPPGKKLQSVNLLSGGEKALTAVSLLFAIFLIRPTPFCLLDEVDAPLDDQNVGRYNRIVKEMSERSQFILITHNKSTMEFTDTLYGVTMEEPGVSKLVSVRLRGSEDGGGEQPLDESGEATQAAVA